ncbi:hypothetical protein GA0070624_3555 [Micromonospora rhizosphaerae]|uniref:Uncharacterized protein n=1 Tax=Micromonospora rhizosphaerae TaxID=568872 RepID=A0A1C6SDY3_9ACTN|nr:hypothetical protein [Micromonospora rhizosphaerae]SCL27706.1 hypothetical protein GA0070624_3555 [Micromonospora rhizosphaerae]
MSGGDGIRPRVAPPAPARYEETGRPGMLRRAGGPEGASPGPGRRDPRFFAMLIGLLGLLGCAAAVALAAPDPALACAPATDVPPSIEAATARPTVPATDCTTQKPTPSPGGVGVRKRLPWIAAEPGQPVVAATPSKLTGSAMTITGLRIEGIVDLPVTEGTLKALKFTVDHAVIDHFLLRSPGPAGKTMRFATDRLTVQGDFAFYATHFSGRLLGIEITLTPELPLPGVIPMTSASPITFTDPAIDLAYVTSEMLAARPKLKLTLD